MQFDDFYLASRRRLVLEAYALTGDLGTARGAVRDAFVAARQHWSKVERLEDPEEWVRPRAWAIAQRRHAARPWHREKGLTEEQRQVVRGLGKLSDQQRKALLLSELAGMSPLAVGRELGVDEGDVAELISAARGRYAERAGLESPDQVGSSLQSLAPVADAAALPPSAVVHRSARRRGRFHLATGGVLIVVLTLLGGLLVDEQTTAPARSTASRPTATPPPPTDETMLLGLTDLTELVPGQQWRPVSTTDNTGGSGINSICQTSRFADPDGLRTMVRTFAAAGKPRRRLVQTVEVSRTARAAAAAYRTTMGWFAGCSEAQLRLLNAYRVDGLGERARLLTLRIPKQVRRTYVVGVVRSGQLTVSTVVETVNGRPPEVSAVGRLLERAVTDLCESRSAGECPGDTRVTPVLPPPSGEEPGTLAAADLPVIGRVDHPWAGTRPRPARTNPAATPCDKTDFVRAGAVQAQTRTFLIPQAKRVPKRFGITETYGTFGNARRARALVRQVVARMDGCEKKDLAADLSSRIVVSRGYRGSEYAMWRLDSEINEQKQTVGFWMGVARVGNHVAQVTLTPAGAFDVDEETFRALVTRARDRLFELQ